MTGHAGRARARGLTRPARLAGLVLLVASLAGCWPAAGQGPDRRSHNPFETGITPANVATLAPVWTSPAPPTASPAGPPVLGNTTVHAEVNGNLHTYDRATGAQLWRWPDVEYVAMLFGVVADGDRVLASAGQLQGVGGAFYSDTAWLDARTGARQQDVRSGIIVGRRGTTLLSFTPGGSSLFGFQLYSLGLLDEATGARRGGTVSVFGAAARPPTLGADRVYYVGPVTTSYEANGAVGGVHAFDPAFPDTCVEPPPEYPSLPSIACPAWSTPTASPAATSPVIGPGETAIYVVLADGTLLALDAADGHVLWQAALGAAPSADPALADGTLYVPLADGDLVALPAGGCGGPAGGTCPAAWRSDIGGAGTQPAVAGGVVLVGTDAGRLVALRAGGCGAATCTPILRRAMGAAVTGAPAITGGRVYVGLGTGRVVALAPTGRP